VQCNDTICQKVKFAVANIPWLIRLNLVTVGRNIHKKTLFVQQLGCVPVCMCASSKSLLDQPHCCNDQIYFANRRSLIFMLYGNMYAQVLDAKYIRQIFGS
jgi:hypothetical protein